MTTHEFQDILEKKDKPDEHYEFEKVVNRPLLAEYIFNSRAQQETYQDETKIKMTTYQITDINHVEYANRLFKQIEEYSE